MKRVWFFDLDGTLADTDRDIREAWKAALAELGLVCQNFDAKFVAGPSIDEMVRRLFPSEYTPELAEAVRAGFGRHYDHDGFPHTVEYPGVLDCVRALKAAGARVYIATNKRWAGASAMAKKFGWDQVFDGLYTSDMHKDNPAIGKLRKGDLLKLAMREIGARPEECVMVGDTINDFEAAAQNGMESVGVIWGYGSRAELAAADRIVTDSSSIDPSPKS